MKILKKVLITILLIIYIPCVVFLTACLLNYNKYNVTEFGKNTLIIIDDELKNFEKGDLAVVYKNNNSDIKEGDYIFFYEATSTSTIISYAEVLEREDISREKSVYTIDGGYEVSSDFVIGKQATAKKYSNVGTILSILESRWGFVLFVIFPLMLIFIYEIYSLIVEIKAKNNEEKKVVEEKTETKEKVENIEK